MKSVSLRNWEVFMLLKCYLRGSIALMLDRRHLEVGKTYRVRENVYLDERLGSLVPVVSGEDVRRSRLPKYLWNTPNNRAYPCNRAPVESSRMSVRVVARGSREDLDLDYPSLTRPRPFSYRQVGFPDSQEWWVQTLLGQMFEASGGVPVEVSWMEVFRLRSDSPLLVVEIERVKEESLEWPPLPGLEYYDLAASPTEAPVPEPVFTWDTPNAFRGPALETLQATRR